MTGTASLNESERLTRENRDPLYQILEASPIAVNISTRDGRLLYCNPQLPRFLGIDREAMLKLNTKTLYTDPAVREALLRRFAEEGPFRDAEIAFKRPDGTVVWLLSSWDNVHYQGEDALLTWLYDITDRKQAESQANAAREAAERALSDLRAAQESLIQAEAMASLGQLVAGVTHDLNTPIGIGVTAASHLEHEVKRLREAFLNNTIRRSQLAEFMDTLEESCRLISNNLNRASELVVSFKRVAVDQSSGDRREFDLRQYIEENVHSLGPRIKRAKAEVTIDCPDGLTLNTYPGALSQVLTNLIVNAIIHAYDDGGRAGTIDIKATEVGDDRVTITVTDHGVGMDDEHLGRVFEAFYSTRRHMGGSGLGLHIVETMVTGPLGGTVTVASTPGVGTTFTVTIPLTAP